MATATATPTGGWSVRLTTDAPGPGAWYRATYSASDVLIATTQDATDQTPPLNTDLDYYWSSAAGAVSTDTVQVTSNRPVLSLSDGTGAMQVVVVDLPPLRFEGNSVAHRVIGRRDPVVSILPMTYPSGRLRLYAADRSQRIALISLLDSGGIVALRSTCLDAVDDLFFTVDYHEDPLVSESRKAGARYMEITFQAVSPAPLDHPQRPEWTWGDVEDAYASWEAVEVAYPTWVALEIGP